MSSQRHPDAPARPAAAPPPAARAPVVFWLVLAGAAASCLLALGSFFGRGVSTALWVSGAYLSYEVVAALLFAGAAGFALRRRSREGALAETPEGRVPRVSVLIAAHNEAQAIVETVEAVRAQQGVEWELIIASDGSTDAMPDLLMAHYAMQPEGADGESVAWRSAKDPRLSLLTLPRVGKGRALNAAQSVARHEVICTLDADTHPDLGALRALAAVFRDPKIACAGGFLYIRNAQPGGPLLPRWQYWEYLKNFIWRLGLVEMDVCLQVSGAFGAFRSTVLRELGGFSERSLVEDYEIIFRLHDRLRRAGRLDRRVEVAPAAVAFTDGPETAGAFVTQRTRWFAGFLETLWEYRRLVGDPGLGVLGWLMLPLKCVDAVLPLWGFTSLLVLIAALASGQAHIQYAALALLGAKVVLETTMAALLWRWHRRHFGARVAPARQWLFILTEGLVFHWFRQIAVLNSYVRFARRDRSWTQKRWTVGEDKPATRAKVP